MLRDVAAPFGIAITDEMAGRFGVYQRLLLEWNERLNLTAITDPEEIAVKHFLDSLLLLKSVELPQGATVLDLGSGAGFPGVPLKIVRPDIRLTLLDSLQKRIQFLEVLSEALDQNNLFVHGRAEDLGHEPSLRGRFYLVTARAVARLNVLSEYCLPFVQVGGVFAALKGPEGRGELLEAEAAIDRLGGRVRRKDNYELPLDNRRSIVLVEKRTQTPEKYPRKPQQIVKAPLS